MPSQDSFLLYRRTPAGLKRRSIREMAARLREEVAGGRNFVCLVTDDGELRRLNRTFLGKDCPTDVLSFPSGGRTDLGEIAISAECAVEQAREYGHTVEQEIGMLMLHGLLHLLGMDHTRDRGRMRRAETRWRKALGLPSGLIERVNR